MEKNSQNFENQITPINWIPYFNSETYHNTTSPDLVIFVKIEFQDTIEFDCNLVVAELNVNFFNFWNLWNSSFYFDNRSKISHCPSQHRELILLRNNYVTQ